MSKSSLSKLSTFSSLEVSFLLFLSLFIDFSDELLVRSKKKFRLLFVSFFCLGLILAEISVSDESICVILGGGCFNLSFRLTLSSSKSELYSGSNFVHYSPVLIITMDCSVFLYLFECAGFDGVGFDGDVVMSRFSRVKLLLYFICSIELVL